MSKSIGYDVNINDYVHNWYLDPPNTNAGYKGHLWVLVKQADGPYCIRTWEKNLANKEELYLQAPAKPSADGYPRLQRRSESTLQSWVLVPVTGDPDTYAIQPKDFPDYALGNLSYTSPAGAHVVTNRTWGRPSFHHYWRLSEPPTDAK